MQRQHSPSLLANLGTAEELCCNEETAIFRGLQRLRDRLNVQPVPALFAGLLKRWGTNMALGDLFMPASGYLRAATDEFPLVAEISISRQYQEAAF